jgi:nitric oxide reductase large subunit
MTAALYEICVGLIEVMPWLMQGIALVILPQKRSGAWWVMAVGTTIQILARIGTSVVMVLLSKASPLSSSFTTLARYNAMTGWVRVGGGAMFAAGFVWFCLKRRAAGEREQQLEAMTAAMAEELRVLRERAS